MACQAYVGTGHAKMCLELHLEQAGQGLRPCCVAQRDIMTQCDVSAPIQGDVADVLAEV